MAGAPMWGACVCFILIKLLKRGQNNIINQNEKKKKQQPDHSDTIYVY